MVMPPIRMTGAISAMTAEKSNHQSSARRTTSAMPIARFVDSPARIISQTATGKARTIRTSSVASPSCVQENGVSLPQPFRCAKKATVAIIRSVMNSPGMRPARKRAPIETFAIMP